VDFVCAAVVAEGNAAVGGFSPVDCYPSHAAADAVRVRDLDLIRRAAEPVSNAEPRPRGGDTGVEAEDVALAADAEDVFEADAVEPAGGAGVPGPPRAAGVGRVRVDVGTSAATAYGSPLYRAAPAPDAVAVIGFRRSNVAYASSPRPRTARAFTNHVAAWVYWPPFSRTPGT
jgi:hypothetical protein